MNYILKNEYYTMTVSDIGAEAISLKDPKGYELLWQNTKDYWDMHAPLLFPVCGSLKDKKYTFAGKEYSMGMHGFIMYKQFTPVTVTDTHLVMQYASNEETLAVYPFEFLFTAEYKLDGENITLNVTIKNNSDITMPYMFGWHPGFTLPTEEGQDIEDYKVSFGELESLIWHPLQHGSFVAPRGREYRKLENNAYRLCEKEIYENDTMIFSRHNNAVSLSADGYPYMLEMSWSDNLPTLCIWKWPTNDSKFLCIEPWSSTPKDGVTDENFDVRPMPRLEAGKTHTYHYDLKIRK